MNATRNSKQTVLIVADVATEAELIHSLLEDDVENAVIAVGAAAASELFLQSQASVLVLAYRDLQEGLQVYLGLYRRGTTQQIPIHCHRAIALCDRKDVKAAYDMCSNALINDYVQFWPTTFDTPRLLMSVRRALRECADQVAAAASDAALGVQAQRLAQLEEMLAQYLQAGIGHASTAGLTLADAETSIVLALEGLSNHLLAGTSVQLRPGIAPDEFAKELSQYSSNSILPLVRGSASTVQPLTQWAGEMEQAVSPHIKDSRARLAQALPFRPTILIVDDDEFQRQMLGRILAADLYHPVYAGNGAEALSMLGTMRPDLILMDIMMPDLGGLEVVRRLKVDPALASIPIIVVSGKGGRETVLESVKLGVADFVVKPIDRKTLLGKIGRFVAQRIDDQG
jgi:CheY-like chemotaxis protein